MLFIDSFWELMRLKYDIMLLCVGYVNGYVVFYENGKMLIINVSQFC